MAHLLLVLLVNGFFTYLLFCFITITFQVFRHTRGFTLHHLLGKSRDYRRRPAQRFQRSHGLPVGLYFMLLTQALALSGGQFRRMKTVVQTSVQSVGLEPSKLVLEGTRTTCEATRDPKPFVPLVDIQPNKCHGPIVQSQRYTRYELCGHKTTPQNMYISLLSTGLRNPHGHWLYWMSTGRNND